MCNLLKPALECRDVTVKFGDVTALSDVAVSFVPGQIHAVVGQNGAGKTTFARVAAGLVQPTAGAIDVMGHEIRTGKVSVSRTAGVELVHQSFALPPSFTVAEIMEFGAIGKGGIYSRKGLAKKWRGHIADLDVQVDLNRRIRDLPIETQQGIEIARALVMDARVLILDEPTAVLSPSGINMLFARVRRLRERGVTVILILHKIREVLGIADTVTVLRGGRKVEGPLPIAEVSAERLANLIVGEAVAQTLDRHERDALVGTKPPSGEGAGHPKNAKSPSVLSLKAVSTRPDSEGIALDGVDLDIRPGEIVGIAGVEGNGQKTLVRAISALADLAGGSIVLAGHDVTGKPLAARRAIGLRIIPFERNVEGLSLTSSLWQNWSARKLLQGSLLKVIRPSAVREACDRSLREWSVHYHNSAQKAGSLSGGNAQKVILAREVDRDARLIIAAQPTRGLDIGATAFVWQALRQARDRGAAILLISSDLDELFDISDRVVVMLSGRVNGEFHAPFNIASVGAAMTDAAARVSA
ncbi:ABC transporter ATP-binding protein [Sinorhizobium meliloti]|uniref:ABC transporter ATP-binding protein n=1 Tax=Rhizobium meliloti TaxID=382 RepID=UPI0002F12054|nr:ATP-binding cassette domain-containing protein [Sinorhizobium meliloti]MDE3761914.1 ATP-binding cassette domain-containing protein [Sinorhizobium meliloti]MDW9905281.1 ATP-binding cassette domain-containing protein [Sinorhizobium meliloti]RVI82307.1 ABC transporter ATP-binding protein [Sinorhizobium meliloti]RVP25337.1 ABC transporter ATP-binding protein [Sinorhizobium meliloti]